MAGSPPSPARPEQAIAWHQDRVPMSKAAFDALQGRARSQAFTVAGAAQSSLLADVHAAIDKALSDGTTLEDFKAQVGAKLESEWAGTVANPASRVETIFRTNVIGAYNNGRHAQATDPDLLELRPFWRYVAIEDKRTSEICRAAHGTLLRHDDPWWDKHFPPQHFNCRCTFETLSPRQAERMGITAEPKDALEHQAGEGFGLQPAAPPAPAEPETRRLPPKPEVHGPSGLPLPPRHLDPGAQRGLERNKEGTRSPVLPSTNPDTLPPANLPAGFPTKSGTYTLPLDWFASLHSDPWNLGRYASVRDAHERAAARDELPSLPPIKVIVLRNGQMSLEDGNHRLTAAREFGVPTIDVQLIFSVPKGRMQAVWS